MVDLGSGNGREILVTDRLGRLHRISPDFSEHVTTTIEPVRYTDSYCVLAAADDLDGDGEVELIFTTAQREFVASYENGLHDDGPPLRVYHALEVVVRNAQLRELARTPVADLVRLEENPWLEIVEADGDPEREILWMGKEFCEVVDYSRGWW